MTLSTYQVSSNGAYWQMSWRDANGQRYRKSLGAKNKVSKREAVATMQRIMQQHAAHPKAATLPKSCTLSEWTERYLELRQHELDRRTLTGHSLTARLLVDYFGKVRIESITKSAASDWRMHLLAEGLAESTVCKHCREAKAILDRAEDEDAAGLGHNFKHLKTTAPVKQAFDRRMITLEDVERVVNAGNKNAGDLVTIAYFTGLRTREIQYLQWEHVDLTRNRITVVPRGGKQTTKQRLRQVRIEPELWTWLAERQQQSGRVLGTCSHPSRDVKDACAAAGVLPFTLQELRQTRDTIWHSQVPSHIACAWLGHTESTARKHYLSVPEDAYTYQGVTS